HGSAGELHLLAPESLRLLDRRFPVRTVAGGASGRLAGERGRIGHDQFDGARWQLVADLADALFDHHAVPRLIVGTQQAADVALGEGVDVEELDGLRAGCVDLAEVENLDGAADGRPEADPEVDGGGHDVPLAPRPR